MRKLINYFNRDEKDVPGTDNRVGRTGSEKRLANSMIKSTWSFLKEKEGERQKEVSENKNSFESEESVSVIAIVSSSKWGESSLKRMFTRKCFESQELPCGSGNRLRSDSMNASSNTQSVPDL